MNAQASAISGGLRLEYLSVAGNALEALLALIFGTVAGRIALVGFSLDSLIAASSGPVLLWRSHSDHVAERWEQVEHRALRLVGISFLALTASLLFEATKIVQKQAPEPSLLGIVITVAALIVMPLLTRAKGWVASSLSGGARHADSRRTDFCAYLSAITLGRLPLNAALHGWRADPVVALALTPLIAKEEVEAVRGKPCCEAVLRS